MFYYKTLWKDIKDDSKGKKGSESSSIRQIESWKRSRNFLVFFMTNSPVMLGVIFMGFLSLFCWETKVQVLAQPSPCGNWTIGLWWYLGKILVLLPQNGDCNYLMELLWGRTRPAHASHQLNSGCCRCRLWRLVIISQKEWDLYWLKAWAFHERKQIYQMLHYFSHNFP